MTEVEIATEIAARAACDIEHKVTVLQDLPAVDYSVLAAALAERGVARLAIRGLQERLETPDVAGIEVTQCGQTANDWRNEALASGRRLVVVVVSEARADHSLISMAGIVGEDDIRARVADALIGLSQSDQRRTFWEVVRNRKHDFNVSNMLSCLAMLRQGLAAGGAVSQVEVRAIQKLDLLRDPNLIAQTSRARVSALLDDNLNVLARLREMNAGDRRALGVWLHNADATLADTARRLLRYREVADPSLLEGIDVAQVKEMLRAGKRARKSAKPTGSDGQSTGKKPTRGGRIPERSPDQLAIMSLLGGESTSPEDLATKLSESPGAHDPARIQTDEGEVRGVYPAGSDEVIAVVDLVVSDAVWGGYVEAPATAGLIDLIGEIAADPARVKALRPRGQEEVAEIIERAVDVGYCNGEALATWQALEAQRAKILPHAIELGRAPLLELQRHPDLGSEIRRYIDVHQEFIEVVETAAQALTDNSAPDAAHSMRCSAVRLDVFEAHLAEGSAAIALPLHPFHLERVLTLMDAVEQEGEAMLGLSRDTMHEALTAPPTGLPFLLGRPVSRNSHAPQLIARQTIGALPVFTERKAQVMTEVSGDGVAGVIKSMIRLVPYGRRELRVALVDVPTIGNVLEKIIDICESEGGIPLRVRAFCTSVPDSVSADDRRRITDACQHVDALGGSVRIETQKRSYDEISQEIAREPVHYTLIFQPGEALPVRTKLITPRGLTPFVAHREFTYDAMHDRFSVQEAGSVTSHGAFREMVGTVLNMPANATIETRTQMSASEWLPRVLQNSIWTSVADYAIDPALNIEGASLLDWRQDDLLDLTTFSAHDTSISELVRAVIQEAGLCDDPRTVKQALREIRDTSREQLLAIATVADEDRLVTTPVAKGVVGLNAAMRTYRATYPGAVMISLDESVVRRWLQDGDNVRKRGDCVGVRRDGQGRIVVDAIEAKCYSNPGQVGRQPQEQIDSTADILERLLQGSERGHLDNARREILKLQLYRKLINSVGDTTMPAERQEQAKLLDDLFREGADAVEGQIYVVMIASGESGRAMKMPDLAAQTPCGRRLRGTYVYETEAVGEFVVTTSARQDAGADSRADVGGESDPAAPALDRDPGSEGAQAPAEGRSPMDGSAANDEAVVSEVQHISDEARGEGVSSGANDVCIDLGVSENGQAVAWDPHRRDCRLQNFGFMISGASGSGKSETIRSIIAESNDRNLPICIFDYKPDYTDPDFRAAANLELWNVADRGLPYNPLEILRRAGGKAHPFSEIHELKAIFQKVFNLGDQQAQALRTAIKTAYEENGFRVSKRYGPDDDMPPPPSFERVQEILETTPGNERLAGRLSKLFDLGLLPASEDVQGSFADLMSRRVVLSMNELPEDIQTALTQLLLLRLHRHLGAGDQPRSLRQLVVFDEAWRVAQSESLERLARESRAFGVGIIVASQLPMDIPVELAANLDTHLFLRNQGEGVGKYVLRARCANPTSGAAREIHERLLGLQQFEGLLYNTQHKDGVFLRTTPFHERGARQAAE